MGNPVGEGHLGLAQIAAHHGKYHRPNRGFPQSQAADAFVPKDPGTDRPSIVKLGRLQLDDDDFKMRDQAENELLDQGEAAASALSKALQGTLSLEARTRAKRILEKVQTPLPTGDELRSLWAVDLLEQLGTSEAKQVIAKVATGDANAWLTREAKAALQRLDKRGVK